MEYYNEQDKMSTVFWLPPDKVELTEDDVVEIKDSLKDIVNVYMEFQD